jgi:predicted nucleic acid-binding protein
VDASVLAVALADDGEDGDVARARLARDPELHVPHLADLEVLSVLAGTWVRGC